MHVHVNDKWLCQNTAKISPIWRYKLLNSSEMARSQYQVFKSSMFLPSRNWSDIDMNVSYGLIMAELICNFHLFSVTTNFQLNWRQIIFSPPGGICDSGRNALTDISRRFIVWWWSIWRWLIMRRCLVVVSGCRVLVPTRPRRVAVALRGSVARGQNLCVPGSRNKADACLAFRVPWWRPSVLHDAVSVD